MEKVDDRLSTNTYVEEEKLMVICPVVVASKKQLIIRFIVVQNNLTQLRKDGLKEYLHDGDVYAGLHKTGCLQSIPPRSILKFQKKSKLACDNNSFYNVQLYYFSVNKFTSAVINAGLDVSHIINRSSVKLLSSQRTM